MPEATFCDELEQAWLRQEWIKLTVTGPQQLTDNQPRKFALRPLLVGESPLLQWTSFDAKKRQSHQNFTWIESRARLEQILGRDYRSAHLNTTSEQIQVRWGDSGKAKWKRIPHQQASQPARLDAHNAAKNYLFPDGRPCPFLIATGVMTAAGKVRAAKYHKFRQINRFAEFVYDLRDHFPTDRPVRVVDYGCGKSYLTFAVHQLLTENLGLRVNMLGLDANAEVITACEQTRSQLQLTNIRFAVADIQNAAIDGPIDLAIWLHACDTATDDALARSLQLQAASILAVPCCQHELHHQLTNDALSPLLRHGILRERLASLTTDALRAQLLEVHGYRTQVIEFIDLEHTAKNLLLRSVRASNTPTQQQTAAAEYVKLKQTLDVKQFRLEQLLGLPDSNESPACE